MGDRARAAVAVEVDAVDEQPVVARPACEACAGVGVDRALGHVDVHADAEVGGQAGGGLERVVGAGERGVDADHARGRRRAGTARSRPGPPGAVVMPAAATVAPAAAS